MSFKDKSPFLGHNSHLFLLHTLQVNLCQCHAALAASFKLVQSTLGLALCSCAQLRRLAILLLPEWLPWWSKQPVNRAQQKHL